MSRKQPAGSDPLECGQAKSTADGGSAKAARLPRLCYRLAALAMGACLALAAVEIGLRLFVPVTDVRLCVWDPILGTRAAPGQSGGFVHPGGPHGHYRLNSQGWNYPEDFVVQREPGITRVCVIGDSFVEALHVEQEESLAMVGQQAMTAAGVPAQWFVWSLRVWAGSALSCSAPLRSLLPPRRGRGPAGAKRSV